MEGVTVWRVFADALARVRRDPYNPTSSLARNTTRRATIRPVRAVLAPVVHPATPGSGRTLTWTPVRSDNPDDAYLMHLQRLAGRGWHWPRRSGGW